MGASKSFGTEIKPTGKQFRGGTLGEALDDVRADVDDAFLRMEQGGYTLKVTYDFDVDGGAEGVFTLGGAQDTVPEDAYVYKAWYVVETTCTSGTDSATIKLGITDQDDIIKSATAISAGGNVWDAGLHDGDADGTAANASAKTDGEKAVLMTVAGGEDLTAGKITVYVQYFIL